jgi:para-nitrobenzyl esterase
MRIRVSHRSLQLLLALSVGMAIACEEAEPLAPGREHGGLFASKTGVRTRVKTRLGEIEGALLRKTRAFFGIPYAQPPVGRLRFSPPKPAKAWSGILDASAFGPMCPQPQLGPLALDYPMNEDCLTLNVYTPDLAIGKPLPVMIFIHGGGFVFGSSRAYTPERLSEAGPVVVVTIQYRLGSLGFLTHPALDALRAGTPSGNDGLRDQQLAVEWVKQNIADYGGDPDNVTLFGESTGSTSVCFHMVMPDSQGLAARAIMQSNECSIINHALTRNVADVLSEQLAQNFCAAASGDELIDCLRGQDPFELSAFGSELPGMPGTLKNVYGNPGWNAVVDGADGILPDSAATLFARGDFAHIPLMVGTTKRETALWRSLHVAPNTFSSTTELEAFWTARSDAKLAAAIIAAYRTRPDEDPNETFDRMVTDIQVRSKVSLGSSSGRVR